MELGKGDETDFMKLQKMTKWLLGGLSALLTIAGAATIFAAADTTGTTEQPASYDTAMIELLSRIRAYTIARQPDFALIGNGAVGLLSTDGECTPADRQRLLDSLDGILAESLYYRWTADGFAATPAGDREPYLYDLLAAQRDSQQQGKQLTVLTLDYTDNEDEAETVRRHSRRNGFLPQVKSRRSLDQLNRDEGNLAPSAGRTVERLSEARNFDILLNPGRYRTKSAYLAALQRNDSDVLIIDAYFGGEMLTKDDVDRIKQRGDGSRRLVFAYLSIGEAASYRDYWQPTWAKQPPEWLAEPNPDWPDSYRVRYWMRSWQDILYGQPDSQLDRIMAAGFSGAMLDTIDAYQYFAAQDS